MSITDAAEQRRLQELKSFGVLDTPPEAEFDRLTSLVARICQVPIALVSLVDEDRQWFKSSVGLDVCETDRDISFCTHTIQGTELFLVPDAHIDPRFATNPLVTGEPHIRFYAGIPLISYNGYVLGSLCAIDLVPRKLTEQQIDTLKTLAEQVMTQLELRRQLGDAKTDTPPDYEVETLLALSRSNRAYKMLLSCNDAVIRTIKEDVLLQDICRIIVEVGGYRMAWVGYTQHDEYKSILPVVRYGQAGNFIEQAKLSWSEHESKGRGPGGRAIRSGQPVMVADVTQDPTYPVLELALQHGFHSMAALPLRHQGGVMGALMLYSADVLHMPKEEINLLQQMVDDLTFGIINIRTQEEQRRI
ncbi:MAG: GAF domain-containing protein, partial [Methylophilaceae bacterium]